MTEPESPAQKAEQTRARKNGILVDPKSRRYMIYLARKRRIKRKPDEVEE